MTEQVTQRGLRLLLLRGENVYTYRGAFELPLDEQGLVFVTGRNLDTEVPSSSGAGKSRLFSLIPRALYGRDALDKEPVSAIWAADGTPGFYEVVYWADGVYYKVREESGSKSAKLSFFRKLDYDAPEWEAIGAKNKKTGLQAEIAASVGRPLDEFLGTVVWKQGHGHVLIKGTPTERIEWLSSLFGLTKYDAIYEEITKLLAANKAKQDEFLPFVGAQAQAKASVDAYGDRAQLVARVADIGNLVSTSTASLDAASKASDTARASLNTARGSFGHLQRLLSLGASPADVKEAPALLNAAQASLKEAMERKALLSSLLQQVTAARSVVSRYTALPSVIVTRLESDPSCLLVVQEGIATKKAAIASARSSYDAMHQAYSSWQSAGATLRSKYNSLVQLGIAGADLNTSAAAKAHVALLESSLLQATSSVAVLESQIASLSKLSTLGGTCPTCGNLVDSEHASLELMRLTSELNANPGPKTQVASIQAKLSSLRNYALELSSFEAMPPVTESGLKDLYAEGTKIQSELTALTEEYASLSEADPVVRQYRSLSQDILSCDTASVSGELLLCENSLASYQSEVARLQSLLPFASLDLSVDQTTVNTLEEEAARLLQAQQAQQAELTQLTSDLAVCQHSLRQLDLAQVELDRLTTLLDRHEELVREGRLLKNTQRAYDKKGFKQHKLRHLLDLIKAQLPVWTKLLFTEQNFAVDVAGDDTKLSLVVRQFAEPGDAGQVVEKVYDVAEMSGGEQSKLAICIMLTLIDIVSDERKCNIAILDEVDRHMDKNALRLMSDHLIRNLAARRSSIYLVSHQIPISSEFNKELVVTKQKACSSMELKTIQMT